MPDKQPSKLELIGQLLDSAEGNVKSARQLLGEIYGGTGSSLREKAKTLSASGDGRIVEGVFDGQNMAGSDNKKYPVPANYASKSKLVEGDVLKLTILDDGSFIYKQIAPVERKKVVGTLSMDGETYRVLSGERSYKVLYASVTYFKGKPGDQVTLLIPDGRDASWGAVENILPVDSEAGVEAPVAGDVSEATPTSEVIPDAPRAATPEPAPAAAEVAPVAPSDPTVEPPVATAPAPIPTPEPAPPVESVEPPAPPAAAAPPAVAAAPAVEAPQAEPAVAGDSTVKELDI